MANPRTIRLAGSGTATQQYELAPGLIQYVQSVRVVVDNTAGADATPVLSISEQSGVVIADVPQNGVIPAGEADGAATWALRLTDDAPRSSGGSAKQQNFADNFFAGTTVPAGNGAALGWNGASGDSLLDLTDPFLPVVIASGIYAISCIAVPHDDTASFVNGRLLALQFADLSISHPSPLGTQIAIPWDGTGPAVNALAVSITFGMLAGDPVIAEGVNSQAANARFQFAAVVVKLA